jgi:hypothetical protein
MEMSPLGALAEFLHIGRLAQIVVEGGADDQPTVGVARLQPVVQAVGEVGVRVRQRVVRLLVRRVLQLFGDVVHQQSETAHAHLPHRVDLGDQPLELRRIGVDHRQSGADAEHEFDEVALGALDEFAESLRVGGGVRLAPPFAVVGVVFRGVEVDVHLVRAHKVEHAQARLVAPRDAVEPLHHAAPLKRRVILHRHQGDGFAVPRLQQGVAGVEGGAGRLGADGDAGVFHGEVVALARQAGVVFHERRPAAICFAQRAQRRDGGFPTCGRFDGVAACKRQPLRRDLRVSRGRQPVHRSHPCPTTARTASNAAS